MSDASSIASGAARPHISVVVPARNEAPNIAPLVEEIVRAFAAAPIDVPRGARIEAMTAGPDRLILALALPEGGRQLVVIDLVKGVRLGTIELHPVP